jgi:thiol-disulfide isomerase/thioredoxin
VGGVERQILHVDCNKFYASVECCLHPQLRDKPVAVGGSEASRHGIVLTKNEIAARYGITGIPAILLFKDGKVAATSVGFKPKPELESFITTHAP